MNVIIFPDSVSSRFLRGGETLRRRRRRRRQDGGGSAGRGVPVLGDARRPPRHRLRQRALRPHLPRRQEGMGQAGTKVGLDVAPRLRDFVSLPLRL